MRRVLALLVCCAGMSLTSVAEDGYDLWLRYAPLEHAPAGAPRSLYLGCEAPSPTLRSAVSEVERATLSMMGKPLAQKAKVGRGALVLTSPACLGTLSPDVLPAQDAVGTEGFTIRTARVGKTPVTLIAAQSDIGVLYGTFDYLRRMSSGDDLRDLDITSRPGTQLRLLNHWDGLDRHVERGYSGESLWDWHKLPDYLDPRYTDYARANASIGINGASLTNVNADATVLTVPYIDKIAALADVFRPYGIRVYLTARFSAPMEIGGLETADPLDPSVREWWARKADDIYARIPDFGGFLVKANSEGQPGPQDYGRTHADGANMLAEAVGPHGGAVMWRAFVYSAETPEDRVTQAYSEFKPLDGAFAENVLLQVKNGPLDFQPREPFHPLFGAMPATPLMPEFQITKEYLGFATHLAYLGPMWEEVLSADTFANGEGSLVSSVVDGTLHSYAITGMAGVANVGTDRNWSGSQFDQANWYAFGRFAWNPSAKADSVAREWIAQTFSCKPADIDRIADIMMGSREAVVDYMTPMGLAHLMGTGHHYGPAPWVDDLGRADWTPYYYHRATKDAVGFDRTASGSDAISQYAEPLGRRWEDVSTTEPEYLLWFHRLSWTQELADGETLWDSLVQHYDRGVAAVSDMRAAWAGLEGHVDDERFSEATEFLKIQEQEAKWWRDASITYWQSINGLPLPDGSPAPEHELAYYKSLEFPYAPGQ